MTETLSDGLYLRRDFLPPQDMPAVLAALDSLVFHWMPSEALRLLGRGRTEQVSPGDPVVGAALDQIRHVLAPAALGWASACGFSVDAEPHVQLFPVRMI